MPKPREATRIRCSFNRREFSREFYRPGVISLTRIVWGSLSSGLLMALIYVLSQATGVAVLFPPLAATCFINATCVYLRVARPKPVIVGHFLSALCGLVGRETIQALPSTPELAMPLALGVAVLLAAVFMQLFDADHPPAVATAAIPVLLPLPVEPLLFPISMAWGATLTVLFAIVWNRVGFEFPVQDEENSHRTAGLFLPWPQIFGLGLCTLGFVLMCCKQLLPPLYLAGSGSMFLGVVVMGTHHFGRVELTRNCGG